jgi:hypothetical protein
VLLDPTQSHLCLLLEVLSSRTEAHECSLQASLDAVAVPAVCVLAVVSLLLLIFPYPYFCVRPVVGRQDRSSWRIEHLGAYRNSDGMDSIWQLRQKTSRKVSIFKKKSAEEVPRIALTGKAVGAE